VPNITLSEGPPGIRSLFLYRPETGRPLMELAEVLLRGDSTLERGERELIAAYVSRQNECNFCAWSHGAFAARQLEGGHDLVTSVHENPDDAPISDKMKTLLVIAGKVRESGLAVTPEDIEAARQTGATDVEIHDTVLIASAFCMFNRYVDGLRAVTPEDPAAYDEMAEMIVSVGYQR
jgi:uncharacterized peroxidase-related enzyme